MIIPISGTSLLIQGSSSFLLTGIVQDPFILFIETSSEEYSQFLKTGDLVTISAPEGGELRQALLLLELVLIWHTPVLVLPSGHPGSQRLKMVVSAGDRICMNCSIERGTHPEQTVICSSDELAGMELTSCPQGVEVIGLSPDIKLYQVSVDGNKEAIQ